MLPVDVLDSLVRRLICTGWDETLRRQAVATASRLAVQGGGKGARPLARAVVSLLQLQGPEAADLRPEIGRQLLELVGRLQDVDAVRQTG